MVDSAYHKARLHQLDFIGEFLQTNVKNGVFMNLDSRYAEYFQNIQVNLEETWDYWNLCMQCLTLESYLLMSWNSGYLRQASLNINARCIFIISMHHMEQKLLF